MNNYSNLSEACSMKEVLKSINFVLTAAIPLSQALREREIQGWRPFTNTNEGENYFSYLPDDIILHILSFIPSANILHLNTIAKVLLQYKEHRVADRSEIQLILQTPEQLSHLERLKQESQSKEHNIERM